MTKWSILTSPLNKRLHSKLTHWLLASAAHLQLLACLWLSEDDVETKIPRPKRCTLISMLYDSGKMRLQNSSGITIRPKSSSAGAERCWRRFKVWFIKMEILSCRPGKRFREEELISAQCAASQNINLWDELELASELAKHSWLLEEKNSEEEFSRCHLCGGKKRSKARAHIGKPSWSDGKCCFLMMELILNAAANWTEWCRGTCLQRTEGKLPPDSFRFVSAGT